jgi:hypothetical protein
LLLELAVWIQSFHITGRWRRRRPFQLRHVYLLMALVLVAELAFALRILGLFSPLG